MTSKNLIKKADKLPNLMGIVHDGKRHRYITDKSVMEFVETDDGVITGGIHIRSKNDISDITHDYFAGVFYHSIKSAVEALTLK